MTGVRIEIAADDAAAQNAMARLKAEALNVAPLLRGIGEVLQANRVNRFLAGKGPGGVPWKPKRRVKKGRSATPLTYVGALRESLTFNVTGERLEVGSDMAYAAIHQFGGQIKQYAYSRKVAFRRDEDGFLRFAKNADARKKGVEARPVTYGERLITIPARPYLDLDDADRQDIGDAVREHLARVLPGPPAA